MRVCPNCGWKGKTKLTGGQIALIIILFICILPWPFLIIYACAHSRKCPNCGCKTVKENNIVMENNNAKN